MATRDGLFIVGVETATLPAAATPSGDSDLVTKGYADAHYAAIARLIVGTRAAPSTIVAGTGVAFTGTQAFTTWFIKGNGADTTVTAAARVAAGSTVGQQLRLIVPSTAVYKVTMATGNGLDLRGTWVGELASSLDLEWDGTNWFEVGRSQV